MMFIGEVVKMWRKTYENKSANIRVTAYQGLGFKAETGKQQDEIEYPEIGHVHFR